MKENQLNISITKLQWACRRGMLELDVLLRNFLDEAYLNLDIEKKKAFVHLLSFTDPELFSWLLGRELPNDPMLAAIIEEIRRHARSRI